jgi:signal transduction histidine kinase
MSFKINFSFENECNDVNPILNPGVVFNMYRIIQEGLNNSIKHSGADNIYVRVKFDANEKLIILIKDNGVGFYVDKVNNIDGYGLVSVKARADEMNALLDINSKPEMGTEIKLTYSLI